MKQLGKLIQAAFLRIRTAVSSPFRQLIVRVRRVFNVNIISSKLISPLTRNIKKMFRLKPRDARKDYVSFLGLRVFKKLFYVLILAACAFIFIYFGAFAKKPEPAVTQLTEMTADTTFSYDDVDLSRFSGVANIRNHEGDIVFTGAIEGGVCRGMGTLYNTAGLMVYRGEFDNNMYSGQGTQYGEHGGIIYEGQFAANRYEGEGRQFDAGGKLIYEGTFKAGVYEGAGTLWSEDGLPAYEGQFLGGLAHGTGKQYFPGGKLQYEGEFYAGSMQGNGTLYAENGLLLYTGRMHTGHIDYLGLLGATLADANASFAETPVIYYQDGSACYLYEQAGVLLTTDCRVNVYEWTSGAAPSEGGTPQWYMPDSQGATAAFTLPGLGLLVDSSSSSSSGQNGDDDDDWPFYGSPPPADGLVDRYKVLYFEVDTDVWAYDPAEYEPLVTIQKVTVLHGWEPPAEVVPLEDDPPPAMEDCVAADILRKNMPTAFPNLTFEMDKQNRLFQRVWNIGHATGIRRLSYVENGVIWRLCYNDASDATPTYFTVER